MVDEQTSVQAVIAGNTEEYRPLVERYHAGLIYYIFGIVGDDATAQDIAQEAFITAYRKLAQYNPKYAFSTWLYRIARNIAYRDLQDHQHWLPYEETAAEGVDLVDDIDHQLLAEDIRRALGTLRPEWRSVIQLYYWEDKSYQEIADIVDAPVNTVRVWLSRAKDALRSELA